MSQKQSPLLWVGPDEVGQSMQGVGGVCPLLPPPTALFSLSLRILPPTPASSLTLGGIAREAREGTGADCFIQHRLNVFTAAQCRGGVGRCKPTSGGKGGNGRKRGEKMERKKITGWPRKDSNGASAALRPFSRSHTSSVSVHGSLASVHKPTVPGQDVLQPPTPPNTHRLTSQWSVCCVSSRWLVKCK